MPNCYVTPGEIKMAMPDGLNVYTVKYDGLLMRLAMTLSRFVDQRCRRVFYPTYETRYFAGPKMAPRNELWVPDLLSVTTISISEDNGATYTDLAATDWIDTVGGDYNDPRSATMVVLDANGDYTSWPSGQRAVKIAGWWGYADNRDEAWEDSGIDLAGNYTAGAAALTVASASVLDAWEVTTALQAGRLIRVDDEVFEVTGITGGGSGSDSVRVVGARNGTTAAAHTTGDGILIWRAPEPVKQACIIQAVRQMERGLQGFGDSRSTPDLGQMFYLKELDPEAEALLRTGYMRQSI